jgi:hypothetical protein
MSIWPDQSQLGQFTIPVVIALRSNSARLMTRPQFGQTWTLSQLCVALESGLLRLISFFHASDPSDVVANPSLELAQIGTAHPSSKSGF